MPRYGSGDSSTVGTSLAGSSSVGSGVPVDRKISKRSSFSWGTSQKAASAAAAEANPRRGNASAGADEDGRNDDVSDTVLTNDRTAFSLTRKSMSVRSSILGASGSSQSLAEMRPESGNRVRTNTAGTMDTADMIHADRPSSRNGGTSPYPTRSVHDDILSETDGSLATPSVTTAAGSINDKLHQEAKSLQIMNDVLRDPSRILALNSSALNLLVRTFFCKVGEIENFCNRYLIVLLLRLIFSRTPVGVGFVIDFSSLCAICRQLLHHFCTSPCLLTFPTSIPQILPAVRHGAAHQHHNAQRQRT
jgi:hypothetical protein